MEDYAARYGAPNAPGGGGPGNAARYVIEGHVHDATREEWDWAYEYLIAHPELLERPVKTDAQLAGEAAQAGEIASELSSLARQAYDNGETERALELIAQAEELHPAGADRWARARTVIQSALPAPAPAEAATHAVAPASVPAPSLAPSPGRPPALPETPAEVPITADHLAASMSPSRFRPAATDQLAPSGALARVRANLRALGV
ncbi:MAG: hypothetical protein QOI10_3491, partial [Solirubrobacterales bacterium]|nr:hypothetical protein [Solirubrobacterales bacterium]